ncbi:Similar to Protein ECM3; acc. no. Q99252 [Pyronema omphalodes CBS 100304]|uniref:Similar to Protein ECM3 acc. no. Q99252 n=1 Tax=Pyronema omphalodes (strain CBS 100304) TaxID=1076935 RepID=U4KUC4_PYROM|nr:Similar to Protein ECM3; acc. no. Q99252 [Pyronema omphalodes CBS 100304]
MATVSARPGIGDVIFIALKPIVKMAAITGGGAFLCRKGILSIEATKANAQMILKFLMPMLIFSTVTASFNTENVKSVGGLVITALMYQAMGLIFGILIWWLTPVPRSWRGGVLVNESFSNWGDLIMAFILTIAKSEPFNGEADSTRGLAYASIFIIMQTLTMFNLGGLQLIQRDFKNKKDDLELNTSAMNTVAPSIADGIVPSTIEATATEPKFGDLRHREDTIQEQPTVNPATPVQIPSEVIPAARGWKSRVWEHLQPFLAPPALAMIAGLIVANISPLKALFVPTDQYKMPNAPDHRPPLDFIMEICNFGGSAVPMIGTILLGAALARLKINGLPKGFWKSALGMAVLKLVVGPIIGLVWTTQVMTRTGLIDPNDKMLLFVMIMSAGVPTATLQVYLTSVYASETSVEMSALSAMLLAQYGLLLFSLTTLVSYTLMNVL